MRFFLYKDVFTPTGVKMGLHTRPISAERVASTAGNHDGLGAVDGINDSRGRTRTCDPPVNSRLLYQLSYSGKRGKIYARSHRR